MQYIKHTFLLLLILPFSLKARQIDSIRQDSSQVSFHKKKPDINSLVTYIPPAVFITYGVLSFHVKGIRQVDYHINEKVERKHPGFNTHADDYLRYAPIVAVYGLDLLNIKAKHNFVDRTALLILSQGIMSATVLSTKHLVDRQRPNGEDFKSFPSGHAATSFASAEYMAQEYWDVSPWYGVAGYAFASATSLLRVYNNAHWFSDIVTGAGYGIISTKLAYLIYPEIKSLVGGKKNLNSVLMPAINNQFVGFTYVSRF